MRALEERDDVIRPLMGWSAVTGPGYDPRDNISRQVTFVLWLFEFVHNAKSEAKLVLMFCWRPFSLSPESIEPT